MLTHWLERLRIPTLVFCATCIGMMNMGNGVRPTTSYVIGPDGGPLTYADLPAPETRRWVARRKAEVVAAVRGGILSLDDACARYALTVEEFLSWEHAIKQHGLSGLRATRMQEHRHQQSR
jgi:hypothetical protein